jgi:hypothetical protein
MGERYKPCGSSSCCFTNDKEYVESLERKAEELEAKTLELEAKYQEAIKLVEAAYREGFSDGDGMHSSYTPNWRWEASESREAAAKLTGLINDTPA